MKITIFVLFSAVQASSLLSIINQVGVFEVANISMVTPKVLAQNALVRVKSDGSVITSQHLLDMVASSNFEQNFELESRQPITNEQRNLKFVQTDFAGCHSEVIESEWEPIEGCIDNTLADTTTTVTRTGATSFGSKFGPRIFFLLLGSSATLAFSVSAVHLTAEKLYCDVLPGETLQIFHKTEAVQFENLRQRELEIVAPWARKKYVKFAEWEEVDSKQATFQYSEQLACVTDVTLLSCDTRDALDSCDE